MQAAFAQHVCCHCRSSCFAVHSGDNNAAFRAHNCSKRFGATHDGFSRITPGHEYWIVLFNCRGENYKIRGARMLGSMLFIKAQTEPLQSICFHRTGLVRAAHRVPELDQKRSETAHTASGNANKMNPMMLMREELTKINWQGVLAGGAAFFRHGIHASYISPLW